jgi:hypothetical protein
MQKMNTRIKKHLFCPQPKRAEVELYIEITPEIELHWENPHKSMMNPHNIV